MSEVAKINITEAIENKIDRSKWVKWKFSDLVENIVEKVVPKDSGLEHYIGLEHLDTDSLKIRRFGKTANLIGDKQKIYKGDLIFAKRNAYLKRVAIAEFDAVASAHSMVLRPKRKNVNPDFLPFFLMSEVFWKRAIEISVGSLSPTINWKALAKQEFLLPPKDQQAQLAELLWAMDEMVETRLELKEKCDILIESYSNHFFESRKERKVPFETTGNWKSGGTPSKKNNDYWKGDIPWVSPKDMKSEFIEDAIDKITLEGANSGSKIIPPNSILIVVRGMILLHSFPIAITGKTVAFNQDMKALLPNANFLPKTLLYFLKKMTPKILSLSSESSHGTKSIPSDLLFGMQIPLIPKEDQEVFVKRIEVIEASITKAVNHLESSKALQKSLINQIF